jgi:hypothetical protein
MELRRNRSVTTTIQEAYLSQHGKMTDKLKSEVPAIKTDEVGRVRISAGRRESLLDEYERGGLSGKKCA